MRKQSTGVPAPHRSSELGPSPCKGAAGTARRHGLQRLEESEAGKQGSLEAPLAAFPELEVDTSLEWQPKTMVPVVR